MRPPGYYNAGCIATPELWNIWSVVKFAWLRAFMCVIRTSKKASWPCLQKFRAFISSRASSLTFAVLSWNISPPSGVSWGSALTFVHTLSKRQVKRSLTLLCLWLMKPPLLQFKAWVTLNLSPHTHVVGSPFNGKLYLKQRPSLNSSLLRSKPCSLMCNELNHELAPLSSGQLPQNQQE